VESWASKKSSLEVRMVNAQSHSCCGMREIASRNCDCDLIFNSFFSRVSVFSPYALDMKVSRDGPLYAPPKIA
jgi:hypothetical protein